MTRIFRPHLDDLCAGPGYPPAEEIPRAQDVEAKAEPPLMGAARTNDVPGLKGEVTVAYRTSPWEIAHCKSHTSPAPRTPAAALPAPAADAACGAVSPSVPVHALPSRGELAKTTRPGRRKRRRTTGIAWASIAVLLGTTGFFLSPAGKRWLDSAGIHSVTQEMARVADGLGWSAAAAPDGIADPVSAPSSAPVTLDISVTPLDAKVLLDGQPIGNPTEFDRPADKLPHELRAEAPGYRTLTWTIRFERDATVSLELEAAQSDARRGR